MPFLLILSAILTALTGVVTGVRPLDLQIARHARASDAKPVLVVVKPMTAGHVHLLGAFGVVHTFALIRAVSALPLAAPRLYLDRLRA